MNSSRRKLRGVLPVFQTPYHPDETIDLATLEKEVAWLYDCGADGIVMAMVSETWESSSNKQPAWGKTLFASAGARLVFTTNGPDFDMVDLEAPNRSLPRFAQQPEAIGPEAEIWTSQAAGRGISVFEGKTLRLNIGLDSEILLTPCFDRAGLQLAWGNADGTVSLCDLQRIRAHLKSSGLTW